MPRPRLYPSAAARQQAFRARKRREAVAPAQYGVTIAKVAAMTYGKPAAELVLVTPMDADDARRILGEVALPPTSTQRVLADVVVFPGSSRPHVRRDDFVALVDESTYGNGRVRLTNR